MTLIATRSREAKELMDYYWDTVEKAVPPETIVRVLEEAGFVDARARVTMPGAFIEYTGRKPASAA
jgi:demethylmenaquinone methyltransferase/2-methoxy-6-polyprenyl-1,4-benzoquinol methylase